MPEEISLAAERGILREDLHNRRAGVEEMFSDLSEVLHGGLEPEKACRNVERLRAMHRLINDMIFCEGIGELRALVRLDREYQGIAASVENFGTLNPC